ARPERHAMSPGGGGEEMGGPMPWRREKNAGLETMVSWGDAAGSAATINQGTRLCSRANTQKIYDYLCGR
ncbi:6-phosphofructokinase II, partial [Klebsiella pneumoniae]|nr:6-phosphofructokinase II [Klebsiella pneumoniae]